MKKVFVKWICLWSIFLLTGCSWSKTTSNDSTSEFVAGKVPLWEAMGVVALIGGIVLIMLVIAVIAGIILYRKGKKQDNKKMD